jgi:ATP-binding cassette subfamily D (ALD) long-chain fatty acid import protein
MERAILQRAYRRLIRHVNSIYKVGGPWRGAGRVLSELQIRIAYEWTEDYVIKYLWSAAGYGLISIPYLQTDAAAAPAADAVADRTEGPSVPSGPPATV